MSTSATPSPTRAPAIGGRAPARAEHDAAAEPAARESLFAHARRSLRTAVSGAVTAGLDAAIAPLQSMRLRVAGPPEADGDDGNARAGVHRRHADERSDEDVPVAQAPPPRRRLRACLVYLGVLLVGVLGGGALAYNFLDDLIGRQYVAGERAIAVKSKNAKAGAAADGNAAEADADAEKALEEATAARAELEKAAEEAKAGRAEAEKALEEARAARVDAEKRLAAAEAAYAKSAAEQKEKLDAAEKRLGATPAAESADGGRPPQSASRSSGGRKSPPVKTGNCAIPGGDPKALQSCLEEFNR